MVDFRSTIHLIYLCSLVGGNSNKGFRASRQVDFDDDGLCSDDMFQCSAGECVPLSNVCNGLDQCKDGSDESPAACDCGQLGRYIRVTEFGSGFREAKAGLHPWHVGIYKPGIHIFTLICIGAIIYDDIVLTAANCLFDSSSFTNKAVEGIHISAGKLKRDYVVEEPDQQKLEVSKVVILDEYEGDYKRYHNNLAMIKLKNKIQRTPYIRPICLWTSPALPPGTTQATIAGWGLQFVGNYASSLREAKANLISTKECLAKFYDPFNRVITSDKFCLTFQNDVGVKDDDAGGAVTILFEGRHYLIGVLSAKVTGNEFAVVTNISKHIDWIKNTTYHLKKSDRQTLSCEIPNANISKQKLRLIKCGDNSGCRNRNYARPNSKYTVTCQKGYGFHNPRSKSITTVCSDGVWVPDLDDNRCLTLCNGVEYKSLNLTCHYLGSQTPCNKPLRPQTTILVSCKRQFKKQLTVNYADFTECKADGTIRNDLSECVPVCGVPFDSSKAITMISKGSIVEYAKYPWHVGLYWKITDGSGSSDYLYKCGGTLIDTNKVLTAGHCIWEPNTSAFVSEDNLFIAVGRRHSNWWQSDPMEQKVGVKTVIPGQHYNGAKTKFSQDIAVLILTKDLQLSDYIMPACLDLDSNAGGIPKNQKGHVIGWGQLSDKDSQPSELLRETYMDYLELDPCRKRFEKFGFGEYLLSDKFCALYNNGSGTQVGDSGGGMTFTHDNLHYVYGVVSIKKTNQNDFAAFTNILAHADWLKRILNNEIYK